MAGSVNKVILFGNLGKDPEVRSMQNGGKVCNLSVATSESWKDKMSGERKERTEWHRVVIFNENLISVAERFQSFTRGVISLRDVVYFASFIGFWLFLTTVLVDQRKAD